MLWKILLLLILLWAGTAPALAQTDSTSTCGNTDDTIGESWHTLTYDGIERRYLMVVPESYNPSAPTPLVMSFHGFASNPEQQRTFSGWDALAEEHGFLLIYPQGTGFPLRWNSGRLNFNAEGADDVGFISALMDHLIQSWCVDPSRIYANGLSNGAGMSHRLACELSDRIAAIGGVAGAYNLVRCQPSRPVPVMAFHGTDDPIVPYEGGDSGGFDLPRIETWVSHWADRNGCDAEPESLPQVGAVTGIHYLNCDENADVIFYTIAGGGHTWPGGPPMLEMFIGITTQDINASALLWEFYETHPLN